MHFGIIQSLVTSYCQASKLVHVYIAHGFVLLALAHQMFNCTCIIFLLSNNSLKNERLGMFTCINTCIYSPMGGGGGGGGVGWGRSAILVWHNLSIIP